MRYKIDPKWKDKRREQIGQFFSPAEVPFEPVTTSYNPAAQWLIMELVGKGLIPKVENLGVGVKRIGVKGSCCKTCGKPF